MLLHMAVQVYGLPFALQVTYQNISWGTAWVNLRYQDLVYHNNEKNNWSTDEDKVKKHKKEEKKKKL